MITIQDKLAGVARLRDRRGGEVILQSGDLVRDAELGRTGTLGKCV